MPSSKLRLTFSHLRFTLLHSSFSSYHPSFPSGSSWFHSVIILALTTASSSSLPPRLFLETFCTAPPHSVPVWIHLKGTSGANLWTLIQDYQEQTFQWTRHACLRLFWTHVSMAACCSSSFHSLHLIITETVYIELKKTIGLIIVIAELQRKTPLKVKAVT